MHHAELYGRVSGRRIRWGLTGVSGGLDGRLHVVLFLIFFLGGVGGSNGKRNASISGVSFQFVWGIFEEGLLSSLSLCRTYCQHINCV